MAKEVVNRKKNNNEVDTNNDTANDNEQKNTKNEQTNEENKENNGNSEGKENKQIKRRKAKDSEYTLTEMLVKSILFTLIGVILLSLIVQYYWFIRGPKGGDFFSPKTNNGRTTRNQKIELQVPLSYVYSGHSIQFEKERVVVCEECEGTGAKDKQRYQCEYCRGEGAVIQKRQMGFIVYESQERCPKCMGSGSHIPHSLLCPVCGGKGIHRHPDLISLSVPAGVPPSFPLIAKEKADEQVGYRTGDLECTIHTVNHPRFTRVNDIHLSLEAVVSLADALLGFSMEITRLDETTFTYTRTEILQPNEKVIIKGEGMPIFGSDQFGDLFITFTISYPTSLSSSDLSRLKELFPN